MKINDDVWEGVNCVGDDQKIVNICLSIVLPSSITVSIAVGFSMEESDHMRSVNVVYCT